MKYHLAIVLLCAAAATGGCDRGEPREPDLPTQPDRWPVSITLDSDSRVQYVGKTKEYVITSSTAIKELDAPKAISVGDEIEGLRIGAIKCSFFWRDASYGGDQFMWRGRWGCQAGRSRSEVEGAVGSDGEKRFDYLYISPVHVTDSASRS